MTEAGPRAGAASRPAARRDFAAAWAIATAFIVYGSLFPFAFGVPAGGAGALPTLLGSWAERPGRGDLLSNVLLYVPFGFFGALCLGGARGAARVVPVVLLGTALSVCAELAQYFDAGRQTAASDVYANAFGTALGSFAGYAAGAAPLRWPAAGPTDAERFPALLLAAWVTYRLYPFVPAIDLHKYWHALRPVILRTPGLAPYDLYRHAAVWLTVGALVDAVAGRRRSFPLFALLAAGVLSARVAVVGTVLSEAEVAGAGVALVLAALGAQRRPWLVTALLGAAVAALRLEPFAFRGPARHFEVVPFVGFLHGSVEVNLRSFLEKFFLYGSLVWLLGACGARTWPATAAVAAALLLTSLAETYLPGRSAEATDAIMAVLAGIILASLRRDHPLDGPRAAPRLTGP